MESRVREGRPIKELQPEISAPGVSTIVIGVNPAAVRLFFFYRLSFYSKRGDSKLGPIGL